jgi:hypothetical protein
MVESPFLKPFWNDGIQFDLTAILLKRVHQMLSKNLPQTEIKLICLNSPTDNKSQFFGIRAVTFSMSSTMVGVFHPTHMPFHRRRRPGEGEGHLSWYPHDPFSSQQYFVVSGFLYNKLV